MQALEYNLCLNQGATMQPLVFVLRHRIVVAESAIAGETTLNTFPLPHPVLANRVLKFGNTSVTVDANAIAGAETLSVNSLSSSIAAATTARGDLIDLSGQTPKAHYKESFDAESFIPFDCSIPGTGKIQVELSYLKSLELKPNIYPSKAKQIEEIQDLTEEDLKLFLPGAQPGVWDLETEIAGDPLVVRKWYHGQVLVLAGVTSNAVP